MKKLLLVILMGVLAIGVTYSQRTITGKVSDESGQPLIGATVIAKGTSTGTITDIDGTYSLTLPQGVSTVIFSYTGFSAQELTVGASNVLNAVLKQGVTLSEAIVTALGIKRSEKSVPYSVQQVNEEELNPIRQTNLNNALAGKVSGIQVRGQSSVALDRNPTIRIRGAGSLVDKAPLYVVDGTPTNSIDVNMDDVESVSVLKGPNATALYGQRGDAGVILITTKKGADRRGLGIELNQSTFFDKVYVLPEYQNLYAGGGESELIKFVWKAGMPDEWKVMDGKFYHDYSDDASWGPKMEGQEYLPWYAWYPGKYFGKTEPLNPQPNNIRDYYETGVTTNTNLNMTKAGDGYNLRLSFTNQNIKGMLPNSGQGKNTIAGNFSYDLGKLFTIGANLNYANTRTEGEFVDDYANQSSGSFNQWFHRDLDMKKMKELRDLRSPEGILASWNHNNPGAYLSSPLDFYGGNYWYNFYSYFDYLDNVSKRNRLFGDVNLTMKLSDDFKIQGFVRQNVVNANYENRTYAILQNSATQSGIFNSYSTEASTFNETNYEILAAYNKNFGDLSVEVSGGGNLRLNDYKRITGASDQGLAVPDLFTLANSANQPYTSSENRYKKEVRSLYARGSFGYKSMLFLDWSARNDWSSALPVDNNSYFYPSVGMSFVFSEMLDMPWLSYGKLRGSWAQVGSDLDPYQLALNYGVGAFWGSNFTMGTPDELVDPNIKPSLSSAYEGGVDLRFFNNRAGLSFTYYNESKVDEILSVAVAGASGYSYKKINAGQIDRNGIELQLTGSPIRRGDLEWNITVNFAQSNNEIVALSEDINAQVMNSSYFATRTGARVVNVVGEQWGQLRGGGFKTDANGNRILDANGFYTAAPDTYFGSVLPDFTGGMFNALTWKDISLSFNLDFQKGGKYFSLSQSWGYFSGLFAQTAATNDKGKNVRDAVADGGGVHVVGVSATGEKIDKYVDAHDYFTQFYFRRIGEEFIFDATYVKLRELAIGYNIPVQKLGLNSIHRAQISLVARNPWLIYAKNRNFDPSELGQYNFGEHGQFPGTRSFGFNLKLGF